VVASFAGAVYPMRMFFKVALGELPKRRGFQPQRVREPGGRMTTPISLLAILAVLGGFIGIPRVRASFGNFVFAGRTPPGDADVFTGMAITAAVALLGVGLAWMLHTGRVAVPDVGRVGKMLRDGLRIDDAYAWVVEHALVRPAPLLGQVDEQAERRVFDEIGAGVVTAAETGRRWQLGRVDVITMSAVAGVAVAAAAVVLGATGHLPWLGVAR
jgi:NADH:ubiquinone oxidoreductase subunit 5 (subunit L)/multisubunit Na+/H+ antiporter MnhA subunit